MRQVAGGGTEGGQDEVLEVLDHAEDDSQEPERPFGDCLFHFKIWQRKPLLGYMHSAIAFGWFMIIILGHIEVALFVPARLNVSRGGTESPCCYTLSGVHPHQLQ